jgi:hypothetical protein
MPAHPLPSSKLPTVTCVDKQLSLSVQLVRLPTAGWQLRCKLQQPPSFVR